MYETNVETVLDAIGEQAALENGLEKHYAFIQEHSKIYSGMMVRHFTGEGPTRTDVLMTAIDLWYDCHEIGINPTYEGKRVGLGPKIKTRDLAYVRNEWDENHIETFTFQREHSFDVLKYSAEPMFFPDVLDELESISPVADAVNEMGRAEVTYALLDHLSGYQDPKGNTSMVLGLWHSATYDEVRRVQEEHKAEQTKAIEQSWTTRIPLIGGPLRDHNLKGLEMEHERKTYRLDRLEQNLVM